MTMGMAGKIAFLPDIITAYRVLERSLCHFETSEEAVLLISSTSD